MLAARSKSILSSSSSEMVPNGLKENLKRNNFNVGEKLKPLFHPSLCFVAVFQLPAVLGTFMGPHEEVQPCWMDKLMVQRL